jgi:hypothetical protein
LNKDHIRKPLPFSTLALVYHHLKPFLPRWLQIGLRRRVVSAQRSVYKDIWPIDKNASKSPEGWPGWPEGNKFAFVLTHDVEGNKGVERCHLLADIDRDLGFRSCFNFVPEACKNPVSLHPHLTENGFEVGVHGLGHNGNLFSSRKEFLRKASKIEAYLKEWQSVGFRTPSMYHNLEWIGELGIEYDSSTFDVDPFEPQPDGMGTIFPFWVQGGTTSKGYVELPYTLPQDFTLFVLMKEKTIDIWKKKLDWIVQKGGMALVITHPDYMNFNKTRGKIDEYPISLYKELLNYVKSNYEGQYWNVLPKEIAHFWRQGMVTQS